MTRDEFKIFLTHGAFCSEGDGAVRLFLGPFERSTNLQDTEIALYCSDFFLEETKPWWLPRSTYLLTRGEFKNLCTELASELALDCVKTLDWQGPDSHEFNEIFSRIQEGIQKGEFEKIVPAVFETALAEDGYQLSDLICWLSSLLDLPSTLHLYGLWHSDYLIVGATPEVLFQKLSGQEFIESMALAGTLPKNRVSERVGLLDDPKELFEHQLVIEDILSRLESFGQVEVDKTGVLELPSLLHLYSPIRLKPNIDIGFEKLVETLHPTPALGVFPRQIGWKILKQFSAGERRAFGAPFGYRLSKDHFQCLVAIRNIQWFSGRYRIGSGCGIIEQSEFEREWDELIQKRLSVRKMLGMLA